jgi:hypothetical protein
MLAETLERVRRTLARLPENRLEARRRITRELGIDPGAEQLQSIVRLAHDPAAAEELGELGRRSLAVRIVADRELLDVFDARRLEPARLTRSAALIPGLLAEVASLEQALRRSTDVVGDAGRDFLLQVTGALLPAREPLLSAVVLLPPLQLLALALAEGDPRSRVPSLLDRDVEVLAALDADDPQRSSRACVNAVALRTIMLKDLAAWNALAADASAEQRGRLLERLERERIAYRVVSDRLQQQQDTALVAGLHDFSEQLRAVKQDLFSTFLAVAGVLKDPAGSLVAPAGGADGAPGADLDRLLARCSEGDAEVEARRAERASDEELYLSALKNLNQRERPPEDVPVGPVDGAEQLRRERLRVRLLGAVAGLLLATCFALPFVVDFGGAGEPRIDVEELPTRLIPIQSIVVGPMLYVQISSWTWNDLDQAERIERVEELGQEARRRGLETVLLTDENDRDLAHWSRSRGVKLRQPGS